MTKNNNNPLALLAVVAGLVLFGVYLYLNAAKAPDAAQRLREIREGRPAPEVVLREGGEEVARFRLASTGFFDAEGARQLHFKRLDEVTFKLLQETLDQVSLTVDGESREYEGRVHKSFITLLLPRRKIFLVKEDGTRTIAALVWREKRLTPDVLRCQGKRLCPGLRLAWRGGVGPLEGPYLDTDLNPLRRGMPRGRWGLGPASSFVIESRQPARAMLRVVLLDPHREQRIRITGEGVVSQKRVKARNEMVVIGGKRLYPKKYLLEIRLKAGKNPFRIEYGDWQEQDGRRPGQRAVYLVNALVSSR
ncbi:MAG TPA: hypothetical protein ENK48_00685 [Gammaproteobacteria bacterium]|nr:hypothetical protein [Gammaproteobacteria bacterium]